MTAPSVLTFIALADELSRVMSTLQGIANGNVGDPMEYAQKVLEATGDAFSPTHQRAGSLANMQPVEFVHKLSDGYLIGAEQPITAVMYRSASGHMYCADAKAFNDNFTRITK